MIRFRASNGHEVFNSAITDFAFPAGERHLKIEERRPIEQHEIAIVRFSPSSMHGDLFQLAVWSDYLSKESPDTRQSVIMPYLPAARADRGNPAGAEVYAQFMADQLMQVHDFVAFDVHSEAAERIYSYRLNDGISTERIRFVEPDVIFKRALALGYLSNQYTAVIAPDKGAIRRASKVSKVLGVPVVTASKERDFETGRLTAFSVPELPGDGPYLVVDDICDGGGTFMGLAAEAHLPPEKLHLYVSHGVFSGMAMPKLASAYGRVITTNSLDRTFPDYTQDMQWALDKTFTQLDVTLPLLDMVTRLSAPEPVQ